jgi:DNA replicative helicase MCM subunit Mcm2 (Cdc46/Mcm family)
MNLENLDNENTEDLQKELEEHRNQILMLHPQDLLQRLIKMHDSTDVILEGYDLVTNINEGHGIAVAGILRLREALMDSVEWINYNIVFNEEIEESEEEEL